jgi:hypothetical protein
LIPLKLLSLFLKRSVAGTELSRACLFDSVKPVFAPLKLAGATLITLPLAITKSSLARRKIRRACPKLCLTVFGLISAGLGVGPAFVEIICHF